MKKGEGTGAPEPPVEGDRRGRERRLRLHAILKKSQPGVSLGTGLPWEEFHVKQKWPVLSPFWHRPPLVETSRGRAFPPGNTAGKRGGEAGGCLPTPSSVAGFLEQTPEPIPLWLPFPTDTWKSDFMLDYLYAAAAAKSLQSCPTLCDPIDGSPLGSSVPGILQARTLEWVAIAFSNAWKWKVKVKSLSRVWLFATPWTEAYQAPLPMGFSRQEYWSGVPLPSPTCGT